MPRRRPTPTTMSTSAGEPGATDRRPSSPRLDAIFADLEVHGKKASNWETAVKIYYSAVLPAPALPPAPAPIASTPSGDLAGAAKALRSFDARYRLRDAASWASWLFELRTRLGHLPAARALVDPVDTNVILDFELDRSVAPLIGPTLDERLRPLVADHLVTQPSTTALLSALRAHLLPDAKARARTLRAALQGFRQQHRPAADVLQELAKLASDYAAVAAPLTARERAELLLDVPHESSVRMRLDELFDKEDQREATQQDWSGCLQHMHALFLRWGTPAPRAPAPPTISGARPPSTGTAPTAARRGATNNPPRGCTYRLCTENTPHRFSACPTFASHVAAGTVVPHYQEYRYTGTRPIPGLPERWRAGTAPAAAPARTAPAPARARQATATVAAPTPDTGVTAEDVTDAVAILDLD